MIPRPIVSAPLAEFFHDHSSNPFLLTAMSLTAKKPQIATAAMAMMFRIMSGSRRSAGANDSLPHHRRYPYAISSNRHILVLEVVIRSPHLGYQESPPDLLIVDEGFEVYDSVRNEFLHSQSDSVISRFLYDEESCAPKVSDHFPQY